MSVKCFDSNREEIKVGDTVDVQSVGVFIVYSDDTEELCFRPYGVEERVCEYFSNDITKV